jgi:hypothetical protein
VLRSDMDTARLLTLSCLVCMRTKEQHTRRNLLPTRAKNEENETDDVISRFHIISRG